MNEARLARRVGVDLDHRVLVDGRLPRRFGFDRLLPSERLLVGADGGDVQVLFGIVSQQKVNGGWNVEVVAVRTALRTELFRWELHFRVLGIFRFIAVQTSIDVIVN